MRRVGTIVLGIAVAAIAIGAYIASTAPPAYPAGAGRDDSRISITGPVRVGATEQVHGPVVSVDGAVQIAGTVKGDVLAIHGNVTVSGKVTGTVTALDGNILVRGRVQDGVTAISGRASIGPGAVVRGDVRSSERPSVARDATVSGDVSKTNFAVWFTVAGWIALVVWWIAVTVALFVIGLLFTLLFPPRQARWPRRDATRSGPPPAGEHCWASGSRSWPPHSRRQ